MASAKLTMRNLHHKGAVAMQILLETFGGVGCFLVIGLIVFLAMASAISGSSPSIGNSPVVQDRRLAHTRETWTNDEMDYPGVDPRRTDISKADQIAMSKAGLIGRRKTYRVASNKLFAEPE